MDFGSTDASAIEAEEWRHLVDAIDVASLLVVIQSRMSVELRSFITSEDVLQEALMHAWRDRARYEWADVSAFRRFLMSLVENRLRDVVKASRATRRGGAVRTWTFSHLTGPGDGSTSPPFDGPLAETTPSRAFAATGRARAMEEALGSLPPDVERVVRLRLFEDVPLRVVAERLELHPSAAKRKLRKGVELYQDRLRVALDGSTVES